MPLIQKTNRQDRDRYHLALQSYASNKDERSLAWAQNIGRKLVSLNVPMEEISEMHEEALRRLSENLPDIISQEAISLISPPLMELTMAYGLAFRKQTHQKEIAYLAQRNSEETVKALLDSQLDSAMLINPMGKILVINHRAAQQYEKKESEITGCSLFDLLPDQRRKRWRKHISKAKNSRRVVNFEETIDSVLFDVHLHPARNSAGQISRIAIFSRDITKERFNEQQLIQLANFDPLTGLSNRNIFYSHQQVQISRTKRNKTSFATLFLDLDNFKEINDTWGHSIGDKLLKSVSQRVRDSIRESDMAARLGGDEFSILIADISHPAQAALVAKKILNNIARPHRLAGHHIITSGSIGIAYYPECGDSLDEINKAADIAMYRAKQLGRNRYCFYTPSLQQKIIERVSLVNSLRQGLKNRELSVAYQPKFSTGNNRICGVEALARWRHGEKGMIPPDVFIPLAEEMGFINEIGKWILRESCRDAKKIQHQFAEVEQTDFAVSVNVSHRQLKDRHFADTVEQALDEFDLPARFLQIELTESSIMEDPETSIEILSTIRKLGVGIAIDDFGTGYSSLSYLSLLPIDTLKVDLSFVQAIGKNSESESIVKSIFALAQTLGLKTVAEGVETQDQIDFLDDQGCDYLQGYYFSKPTGIENIFHTIQDSIH